jgi:hypothetical protein
LAKLKKQVGIIAQGDLGAKAMIMARYLSAAKLFERNLDQKFDTDRTIQKKLKIDFHGDLMAYVEWVNGPDNQVPVHANARLPKSGAPGLKQHVGYSATGVSAAKAIIFGYYHPYAPFFQEVINRQFEADSVIQMNLQKAYKNNLYAYVDALYSYK